MNAISKQSDTAIASRPILSPQTFDQLLKFSEFAAQSDLMPRDYKGKPANIFLAIQMGSELGLAPMQSLQSIAVINGRPGVYGDGLIGLCRQSPLCEDIREWIEGTGDQRTAYCEARRRGAPSPILGQFSVADAKQAMLWTKSGPWTQYPDRMLQSRARGFCLRDAFPDLLRGLKTVEELHDIPEEPRRPKPVQATVIPQEPKPVNRMSKQELDLATKGDRIPDDIPPWDNPIDRAAAGVHALEMQIRAAASEDELHAIAGDAKVVKQREWLARKRPELDQMLADALGERYAALVDAKRDEEAQADLAMAGPDE